LIFAASLHQGTVPQDWKKALVTPLFKKGEKSNQENYHPISLACVCSKILEQIIHTNIMKHLSNCHIFSDVQFGFREHCSAELQLINSIHDFALNLNGKSQTDIILLDLSKVFDKVPHHFLLHKLKHYGIRVRLDC